jgi:hypothetical protein
LKLPTTQNFVGGEKTEDPRVLRVDEVNLSTCNLPVTFALKDTPNLGIWDLSVRFLAGDFGGRGLVVFLPPSFISQRTKATHHFDHPRAAASYHVL